MKSVYASKLYKSSKYQDKIRANMNNPINKELVAQLSEYLSDEAVVNVENDDLASVAQESNGNVKNESTRAIKKMSTPVPKDRYITNLSTDSTDNDNADIDVEDTTDEDMEDNSKNAENNFTDNESNDSDNIEESTSINSSLVTATCGLNLFSKVDEVKGLLNSRSETAGVNRILVKDNEFWIYYNDNINLNNVMGTAIELLNAANYYYLDFNRLARSENAIVFQINLSYQSVDPIDNEK